MIDCMSMLDFAQLEPDQRRPIRRVEYDAMGEAGLFPEERVELVEGVIVRMSPRSAGHDSVVERLTEILVPGLSGRARVRVQLAFAASDWSELEPDIAVVPLDEPRTDHPSHGLLLIEVAASSLRFDRKVKSAVFARAGVPHYWIVDVEGRSIEAFEGAADAGYTRSTRHELGAVLAVPGFEDVRISLAALFE